MKVINFDKLNSTNTYAKEHIEELNHFEVIVTKVQTAGYGQWGRKWIDVGEQNIYMTIVLKPEKLEEVFTDIVRYTAVCLCHVFEKYNICPKIKEPNDIMVNNKKIAGILAESSTKGDILNGIIIGVGINLNTDNSILEKIDQPATSLNLETGKFLNKDEFLTLFFDEFEKNYPAFLQNGINLNSFL